MPFINGERLTKKRLGEILATTPLFTILKDDESEKEPLGGCEEDANFEDPSEEMKRWILPPIPDKKKEE